MAKKIKVEFEIEPKELKKLAQTIAKWKALDKKELKKLSKKGVLRSAGALVEGQAIGASSAASAVDLGERGISETFNRIGPQVEKRSEEQAYVRSIRGGQRFGGRS